MIALLRIGEIDMRGQAYDETLWREFVSENDPRHAIGYLW